MSNLTVGTGSSGVGMATLDITMTFVEQDTETIVLPGLQNPNSPCQRDDINLSLGDNTININPLSSWIVVKLPDGNTIATTERDPADTTGSPFYKYFGKGLPNPPPASIVVHAAAAISQVVVYQG